MSGNHFVSKRFQKNNRQFGYPETKITDFKTNLHHCRLILENGEGIGNEKSFPVSLHSGIFLQTLPKLGSIRQMLKGLGLKFRSYVDIIGTKLNNRSFGMIM